MFKFFDKHIEQILWNRLHKQKESIINKTINKFKEEHPEADVDNLRIKLNKEAKRVYRFTDRSILRDRVQRARWTFWASCFITIVLVATSSGFNLDNLFSFLAPLITALTAWIVSVGTISISYNQRVKGAMDTVIDQYEESINASHDVQLTLDTTHHILNRITQTSSTHELISETPSISIVIDPIGPKKEIQEVITTHENGKEIVNDELIHDSDSIETTLHYQPN